MVASIGNGNSVATQMQLKRAQAQEAQAQEAQAQEAPSFKGAEEGGDNKVRNTAIGGAVGLVAGGVPGYFMNKAVKETKNCNEMQLSFIQLDDPLLLQIKEDILNINIDTLTPVEALMKLNEIKKLLKKV